MAMGVTGVGVMGMRMKLVKPEQPTVAAAVAMVAVSVT
jgi:hypothetical protein